MVNLCSFPSRVSCFIRNQHAKTFSIICFLSYYSCAARMELINVPEKSVNVGKRWLDDGYLWDWKKQKRLHKKDGLNHAARLYVPWSIYSSWGIPCLQSSKKNPAHPPHTKLDLASMDYWNPPRACSGHPLLSSSSMCRNVGSNATAERALSAGW